MNTFKQLGTATLVKLVCSKGFVSFIESSERKVRYSKAIVVSRAVRLEASSSATYLPTIGGMRTCYYVYGAQLGLLPLPVASTRSMESLTLHDLMVKALASDRRPFYPSHFLQEMRFLCCNDTMYDAQFMIFWLRPGQVAGLEEAVRSGFEASMYTDRKREVISLNMCLS